jgi:hypothetical protein
VYDETTELWILAQLDQPPPDGYTTCRGGLVARTLGDVPALQVWRVLQKHGIHLQRRRSCRVSADPQFGKLLRGFKEPHDSGKLLFGFVHSREFIESH